MDLDSELKKLQNPKRAKFNANYLRTTELFYGVSVPDLRIIAAKLIDLDYGILEGLLKSDCHEKKLIALFVLVRRLKSDRENVKKFFLSNLKHVDNWDLTDSCTEILSDEPEVLKKLARSSFMWTRRISVVSCLPRIRKGEFSPAIYFCELFIKDPGEYMHKACGWILREIGKKDRSVLISFLESHAAVMPRIMLRYSIEHLPTAQKKKYLLARKSR